MSTAMKTQKSRATERRVYLILGSTARHLTCQDLLRITEIAEQGHAAVQISYGAWQVLLNVPEIYYGMVAEALRGIGYECDVFLGEMNERSTFALKERRKATCDPILEPSARSGSPTHYQ
jgi:hypothetical protein